MFLITDLPDSKEFQYGRQMKYYGCVTLSGNPISLQLYKQYDYTQNSYTSRKPMIQLRGKYCIIFSPGFVHLCKICFNYTLCH